MGENGADQATGATPGKTPGKRPRDRAWSDLGDRIAEAQDRTKPAPGPNYAAKYNALSLAWRMTLELVVGSAIGFAMGYGLDWLFGTTPLFLIIFGLFGFAAGVRVVMSTAQEASRQNAGDPGAGGAGQSSAQAETTREPDAR